MLDRVPGIYLADKLTGVLGLEVGGVQSGSWLVEADRDLSTATFVVDTREDPETADELNGLTELAVTMDGDWETNSHMEIVRVEKTLFDNHIIPHHVTISCESIERRLAQVWLKPGGSGTGKERLIVDTYLGIAALLWNEAQADGELEGFDKDWTGALDSRNNPGDATLIEFRAKPGSFNFLQFMQQYGNDMQHAEWRLRGHLLRMFNYGTSADDFYTPGAGLKQIVLESGIHLREADRKSDAAPVFNRAFVYGEDNRYGFAENAAAIAGDRKRTQVFQASGVVDQDQLDAAADAAVNVAPAPIVYKSVKLNMRPEYDSVHPFAADSWGIGDKFAMAAPEVQAGTDGDLQVVRAAAMVLTWDANGTECVVDLDVRRELREDRNDVLLQGLLSGRPGSGPAIVGRLAPAPPTGLGISGIGSLTTVLDQPVSGQTKAKILGLMVEPTLDSDGKPLTDFSRLLVQWQYVGRKAWRNVEVEAGEFEIPGLDTSRSVRVRGYAIDVTNNFSVPLGPVTITTAGDDGTYRSFSAGVPLVTIESTRYRLTKVTGGVASPTGSGIDVDSDRGMRLWKPDGTIGIDANSTNGSLTVSGGLTVGGSTVINGTLTVHASATFDGSTTIGGTLTVNGTTSLGGTLSLAANLTATGHTIHGGSFDTDSGIVITGTTITLGTAVMTFSGSSIQVSDVLAVGGALSTSSTLTVSGTAVLNGDISHTGSQIGFYGHSGQAQQNVAGAAAATLLSLQTTVNSIRTLGLNLGLWSP